MIITHDLKIDLEKSLQPFNAENFKISLGVVIELQIIYSYDLNVVELKL